MKKNLLAMTAAVSLLLCGCQDNLPYDSQKDVFLIDELHVTSGMVNILFYAFENQQNELNRPVYGDSFWDIRCFEESEMTYAEYEKEFIFYEDMMNMFCLSQMWLEKNGFGESLEDQISDSANVYYTSLDDKAQEFLGVSYEDAYEVFKAYYTAALMQQEINKGADSLISEEEFRVITVQELLFGTENEAREFLRRLDGGEDVYSLANLAASSSSKNISREDTANKIEEQAFKLREGEHSEISHTDEGFLVAVVTDTFQEELSEERKESLLSDRQKQELKKACEVFRSETEIYISNELWDSYSFKSEKLPDGAGSLYEYLILPED